MRGFYLVSCTDCIQFWPSAFDVLNRKGLYSPTVQGIFHHNLNEGLLHISAARFQDLWCLVGSVNGSSSSNDNTVDPKESSLADIHFCFESF